MADYSRYKTETLEKMLSKAWDAYYAETIRPIGNWGDGMRLSKLPSTSRFDKARDRYYAIKAELESRKEKEKENQ